jgi:hypothetical protein
MKKGPCLVVYDHTNTERVSALDFGTMAAGSSSQEFVVWVWNKKDFDDAPKATDIRVSVLAGNKWSEGIVDGHFVSVRSNGVLDPDGLGIIDDEESQFTPIGGPLTNPGSFHSIGDIPTNCARRLFFRVDIPEDWSIDGIPRLLVQTGFLSEPVKWLYVAD